MMPKCINNKEIVDKSSPRFICVMKVIISDQNSSKVTGVPKVGKKSQCKMRLKLAGVSKMGIKEIHYKDC